MREKTGIITQYPIIGRATGRLSCTFGPNILPIEIGKRVRGVYFYLTIEETRYIGCTARHRRYPGKKSD